ncbi:hypothetical protein ABMB67_001547 [Halalkalibacter oceani]
MFFGDEDIIKNFLKFNGFKDMTLKNKILWIIYYPVFIVTILMFIIGYSIRKIEGKFNKGKLK